jgi:hypothetical protein
MVKNGDFASARKTAGESENAFVQTLCLLTVQRASEDKDDLKEARQTASEVYDSSLKEYATDEVICGFLNYDDFVEARELARSIDDPKSRASAFLAISCSSDDESDKKEAEGAEKPDDSQPETPQHVEGIDREIVDFVINDVIMEQNKRKLKTAIIKARDVIATVDDPFQRIGLLLLLFGASKDDRELVATREAAAEMIEFPVIYANAYLEIFLASGVEADLDEVCCTAYEIEEPAERGKLHLEMIQRIYENDDFREDNNS